MRIKLWLFAAMAMIASIAFVDTSAQDPNVPESTEVVTQDPSIAETPLPAWMSLVASAITFLLGLWTNKKVVSDKATAGRDLALDKLADVNVIFQQLANITSRGNISPVEINGLVQQAKAVIARKS